MKTSNLPSDPTNYKIICDTLHIAEIISSTLDIDGWIWARSHKDLVGFSTTKWRVIVDQCWLNHALTSAREKYMIDLLNFYSERSPQRVRYFDQDKESKYNQAFMFWDRHIPRLGTSIDDDLTE